jgi:hypothetical protein
MHYSEFHRVAAARRFAQTGKLFAYSACFVRDQMPKATFFEGADWRLTVVVDDERGHYQQTPFVAYGTEQEMRDLADRINRDELKLGTETSIRLVAQSMRGGRQ